jgi:hypothetical protein
VRILVPCEHLGPVGGAQRSIIELAEALAYRGHEFVVAYRVADSFTPRWEAIASRMIPIPLVVSPRFPVRTVVGSIRSTHKVLHTAPDLI